jgi:two-component system nitrogen regulation sensor histidine kinase NtrY
MAESEPRGSQWRRKLRRLMPILIPVLVIMLSVTAAYMITNSQQIRYSQWYSPLVGLALININIILVLILLVVIFRNLVKLLSERKRHIPGARFRTKLVLAMIGVTIVPTLLVSFTAVDLVAKIIDFWSAQPVDKIVSSSRDLATEYLQSSREKALSIAREFASYISDENLLSFDKYEFLWRRYLEPQMEANRFDVLDIYLGDQPLVPTVVNPESTFLPYLEDPIPSQINLVLGSKRGANAYRFTEEELPAGTLVRCAVPIFGREEASPEAKPIGAVVLGFGVRRNLTSIAGAITGEYKAYREQAEQREVVKLSSQVLLLVFMLISLFSAIWIGIYFSKGITVPIQRLLEGTKAVAAGNLDFSIEPVATDELGTLITSFNQMTHDLKVSNEELEEANRNLVVTNLELERRRRYTETLLSNLSSAVISLDAEGRVTTINPSAREMLRLSEDDLSGREWRGAFARTDLQPLADLLERFFEIHTISLTQEVDIRFEEQILHLSATATAIRHDDGTLRGTLIVLDDLTQLVRAQRTAAWREVAQRIAHEIRNPLTPIQLSAERILRKIRDENNDHRELIASCTETIIEETGTLKSMVDAFSSFARMPAARPVRTDINYLIEKATSIYRSDGDGFRIERKLGNDMPEIDIDVDQMKMAFVNIINNAIDAMDGRGLLKISSRFDARRKAIILDFADDGPGIPADVKEKLFIPYFSTKKKGTGLGLAIVHRIISDHKGSISVSDNRPRGARFTIELPVE